MTRLAAILFAGLLGCVVGLPWSWAQSSATLMWTAVTTDATGAALTSAPTYNVYRFLGACPGTAIPGPALVTGLTAPSYTDATIPSSATQVCYDVTAQNAGGESAISNQVGKSFAVTPPVTALPDLIVTSISLSPANPIVGQTVVFSAVVKNIGTAPTPWTGNITTEGIGISFSVDGSNTASCHLAPGPLAVGASLTLIGDVCTPYVATAGSHTVVATADDVHRITEANKANNTLAQAFTVAAPIVAPAPPSDLMVTQR